MILEKKIMQTPELCESFFVANKIVITLCTCVYETSFVCVCVCLCEYVCVCMYRYVYVAGICRNPAFPEMPRQLRKLEFIPFLY